METRESQALRTVNRYKWFSAGMGLLPVPFVDVAGITVLQLRMLQVLSQYYEVPFSRDLGKKIISSLLGSIVPASLSGLLLTSTVKVAPVAGAIVGTLSMPVFAGAATYAIGKVFIQHFEAGGTLLDFEPAKVQEYFREQFEKGRDLSSEARGESSRIIHPSGGEI